MIETVLVCEAQTAVAGWGAESHVSGPVRRLSCCRRVLTIADPTVEDRRG
jgi:hypothetical protein